MGSLALCGSGRSDWLDAAVCYRAALLTFASAVAVAGPSFAQAAPQIAPADRATEFFLPADPGRGMGRRSDAAMTRSRAVWIVYDVLSQPENLPGRELVLELFEDATVSLRIERLKRRSPDAYTLTGTVLGPELGSFTLVIEGDIVLANIRASGRAHYQLRYLGQGIHEIREINAGREEPCGLAGEADLPSSPRARSSGAQLQSLVDDGSELDVLVVYSPAALVGVGGLGGLRALVELGVSETNFAFENSAVPIRVRIVQVAEVAYQESGDVCTDRSRLRDGSHGLDAAHGLRDQFCADVVTLVLDDADPTFGGCAFIMYSENLPPFDFAPFAVNVVERNVFSTTTFAHELGHNLGGAHDRESGAASGSYDFSFGYGVPDQFRTLMASSIGCSDCPRMPFYSNPNVPFDGLPTGVPEGDIDSADNALTFELNKEIAANWRASCTDAPPGDLGLPPPPERGDLLTANSGTGELLRVDPSGDRGVLSSDAVGSGPALRTLSGVAVESRSGQIVVSDRRNRTLLRIDPQTGDRTILSGCVTLDCSDVVGEGLVWEDLFFFAMERSGDAVVTDSDGSTVFRVAGDSGDRVVLSGCADEMCSSVVGQGPELLVPFGVAIDSGETILVAARILLAVVRIDPENGDRVVVSGCLDESCSMTIGTGPPFEAPRHLAVEADRSIVVAEGAGLARLIRVDPNDGDRTLLSGCADLACTSMAGAGPLFSRTNGVTVVGRTGDILVSDGGTGALIRVDPVTGDRTVFSGCVDTACSSIAGDGPMLSLPVGMTTVPEPEGRALLAVAIALLAALERSQGARRAAVRRQKGFFKSVRASASNSRAWPAALAARSSTDMGFNPSCSFWS